MVTNVHSPRTACKPRSRNCRKRITDLVMPNTGSTVCLHNELTLKRYAREKGHVVLRPENKAYPVIRPKGDAEVFGVVVGLFRKYR